MEGAIRYVVTVKAVIEKTEMAGKEWQRVTAAPDSPFAYTPEIEKTVRRDIQVYEQTIDKLDLPRLVKAVNGMY